MEFVDNYKINIEYHLTSEEPHKTICNPGNIRHLWLNKLVKQIGYILGCFWIVL